MPTHPELTKLLRDHLANFEPDPDGRLFSGVRGSELPTITYRRAWAKAGQVALTAAEQASPLARRPYDLRHACLSTWLNGGVYPIFDAYLPQRAAQERPGPPRAAQAQPHGSDVAAMFYQVREA